MKNLISQPMAGKTNDELQFEREEALEKAARILCIDHAVLLDSYWPNSDEDALTMLGKSIQKMAEADYVVFAGSWGNSRGCIIEYECARRYGKKILDIKLDRMFRASMMDFGDALRAMKAGRRMTRAGWNGKGLSVVYQKGYPQGIACNAQTAKAWGMNEGELFKCEPYFQISTVDGSHAMWVPSVRDCLADDWKYADEGDRL